MKYIIFLLILLLVLINVSCSDYLDVVPDDIATLEDAFSMRAQAEKFLFTCYSFMPKHADVKSNPAFLAGDEVWIINSHRDRLGGGYGSPFRIATGQQNVSDPINDCWRGSRGGVDLYKGISNCNIFLDNIDNVVDIDVEEKERWICEVKFLKAYYHYWLARMYGPIVIKDKNLPVDVETEKMMVYRSNIDDVFDYIVSILDEVLASENFPNKISDEINEMGRITKTIAAAVKAEVLVTAASPLFNGNEFYSGLVDNRGQAIFNSNKSEEEKQLRWNQAVEACREAVVIAEYEGFHLYEYASSEYEISEETRAKLSIRGSVTERWNSEVIWGNTNQRGSEDANIPSQTYYLQLMGVPRGLDPKRVSNVARAGNHGVPLKIASLFYSRNGVPIDEDVTWDYEHRFDLRIATEEEKYYIKEDYLTAQFNFDREVRYYSSLGFDGGIYFGMGELKEENSYYVQQKKGQPAANVAKTSTNVTGIYPKKLLHFKSSLSFEGSKFNVERYAWPVMRLANLYLLYAEALNEVGDSENALVYINRVRGRAKLPTVQEAWSVYSNNPDKYTTSKGLREIIHQERLIELAFEGQRYWDLRRWNKADEEFNKPITGWNLNEELEENYYKEVMIYQQTFALRDYFWPIHQSEILSNPNTLQNYGW